MRYLFLMLLLGTLQTRAADSTKLYNPAANVAHDITAAVAKAKAENKRVLLQIGGNWCIWCYRFNAFVQTNGDLKKLLNENYVVYHLNYSTENKNEAYLKKLGNPQRFGFPVLVLLDGDGRQLHTQNTALLEKGNGYDLEKVQTFLARWKPAITAN